MWFVGQKSGSVTMETNNTVGADKVLSKPSPLVVTWSQSSERSMDRVLGSFHSSTLPLLFLSPSQVMQYHNHMYKHAKQL